MIPVWRRPEILNICIQRFLAIKCPYADTEPVFIISKEDPEFDLNYQLVRSYKYLIYKNAPLGEKKNAGLRFCRNFEWDYFMDLNSDNVFTPLMWHYYKPYFDSNTDFFGLANGHYFYHLRTDTVLRVTDYAYNEEGPVIWNGGRMIRRAVIDTVGDLWRDDHHTGMDGMSHYNITQAGFRPSYVNAGTLPLMMNLISNITLTPIEMLEDYGENVSSSWAREVFGLDEITPDIDLLTFGGFHAEVEKQAQSLTRKEDAFNTVNARYERAFGVVRYKNYDSYKTMVGRTYGKL